MLSENIAISEEKEARNRLRIIETLININSRWRCRGKGKRGRKGKTGGSEEI